MVIQNQILEAAIQILKISGNRRLPNILSRCLRGEQDNPFLLPDDHPFKQHEPNECLSESHAVTKEGAAVLPCNCEEIPVGILLVLVEDRKYFGVVAVLLVGRQGFAAEKLVQRFEPDFKR